MTEVAKIQHQEPVAQGVAPMVQMIERIAMDPSIPIDRLEQMLAMKERMDARAAEQEFASAFASASAEFPTIPLNGKGHNGKPYALLKDITALTRPILSRHGLALTFSIKTGDKVVVTAELMHRGGHSKSTSIELPADNSGSKNAVQAVGSSQTYGQRYTAQAILGLSLGEDTDDDGAAAGRGETISADEWNELKHALEATGSDEAKFCAHFRIQHLEELPKKRLAEAEALLRKKKGQQ